MITLYITVGIPGCGKSTFCKRFGGTVVYSSDAIRGELFGSEEEQRNPALVFKTLKERANSALAAGKSVIVDATSISKRNRRPFFNEYRGYDRIVALYFDVPLDVCLARNASRDRHVPENVIRRMANSIEVPTKDEGFDEIIVISS